MATNAEIRAEVVRQRAFIRAAETQGTKILGMLDEVEEPQEPEEPPVEPEPEPAGEWDGSWTLTVTDPGGSSTPGSLTVEGDTVTLASGGLSGTGPATVDGASLSASLDVPGAGQVDVSLTIDGDALSGSFTAGGGTFTVAGSREDPQEPGEPEPPTEPGEPGEPAPGAAFVHVWSQYADTGAMLADSVRLQPRVWANTGGSLELAREGGVAFLRTNWGGGPYVGSINDEQIALDLTLPEHARAAEVWLELPLRYSANFRVESDHKTLFVFTEDGQRWEMRFGGHRIRAQAKIDNDNVQVATDASGRELDITNPVLVWDGKWHTLRLHLRSGSGGRFRAWLDGRLLIDAAVSTRASRFAVVAMSRNGDPVDPSTLDWGDVSVHLSDPGA